MALPPSIVKLENVWFNASAAPANLAKLQHNIFYLNSDDHHQTSQELRMLVSYMQKTCDVAEKAILAKKNLRKKCVNRDKM